MLGKTLTEYVTAAPEIVKNVGGYLSDREIRFLALLGGSRLADGEILEIGSFQGKSTVILAKAANLVGDARISAVDPLVVGEYNSPRELIDKNLSDAGVKDFVDFHQMMSHELAPEWSQPLRLLWIDGDHSYVGASTDFNGFAHHLADGGIIAFHDTINFYDGSLRVFMEDVLLNEHFGAAGLWGTIGWARYHTDPAFALQHRQRNLDLYRRLSRLVPYVAFGNAPTDWWSKASFRFHRCRVPHQELAPEKWLKAVA
ncbi:MAG: hypothetical protein CMJ64_04975 [Planctomycetaceae bacterium]|nr:hypothetical protein [Planctomycetaceae bacterium]